MVEGVSTFPARESEVITTAATTSTRSIDHGQGGERTTAAVESSSTSMTFSGATNVAAATSSNEILIIEEDDFNDEDNNAAETELASMSMMPTGRTTETYSAHSSSSFFRWSPTALAFCHTTPWLARVLFPTVCIATHILFYYGQTAPMWKLRLVADIDVWANATDFTTKQTFNLLGLKYDNHFAYQEDRDVQTFTYYFAIHHLWMAQGIPGKVLPRLAAVLLIVFSGFWPHAKLLWLQATWFFRKQAAARTTTLQWLSTLGKWSLADVLVVCVMVGVLNLDWIVDPDAIKEGIITDLPAILQLVESQYDEVGLCNKLLKLHCQNAKKAATRAKCSACTSVVTEAYTRPDWAQSTGRSLLNGVDTSGGGMATLRVLGMRGIYVFCGAVIISILLSLMVDIFDHRAKVELRTQQERERALAGGITQRPHQEHQSASEEEEEVASSSSSPINRTAEEQLQQPLLGGDAGRAAEPLELDTGDYEASMLDRHHHRRRSSGPLFSYRYFLSVLATILLVLAAVDWNTMERKVFGAGPQMLHDILGVDWERNYSLRSLMWTAGAHGGWDYMLMGTFGLFCVLGPVLRAVLLLVVALLDRCRWPVEPVANLVNFIGSFCSWEVFAIAIVMVQMLMPSITNTIIRNKVCEKISDDGSCLQVEFNILPWTFWTVVLGGVLLVAVSCVAINRGTDRSTTAASTTASSSRVVSSRMALLSSSRVMAANHDYERLQGGGQGTSESVEDDELHELVFETNQV